MTSRNYLASGKPWQYILGAAIVGLVTTVLFVRLSVSGAIDQKKDSFVTQSTLIRDTISRRVQTSEEALHSLQILFNALLSVDADQFRAFSEGLLAQNTFIQSIQYHPLVVASDRAEFERRQREMGYPGFRIGQFDGQNLVPATERDRYFPLLYLEPLDPATAEVLGFDMLSKSASASVIQQAIDSGDVMAAFPDPLHHDSKDSYVLFKAVYAGMTPPSSVDQRRRTANGLLALVININKLVEDTHIGEHTEMAISLQPGDGNAAIPLETRRGVQFAGQPGFSVASLSEQGRSHPPGYSVFIRFSERVHLNDILSWTTVAVLMGGLLLTALLMVTTRSIIARAREISERNAIVEALVTSRTRELAIANESLSQTASALESEKNEQKMLITKLQSAQSQLLQSEKMASIGQLAAGVAHEINNPVGFIHSNIGSLQRGANDLLRVLAAYEAAEPLLEKDPELLQKIEQVKKETDLAYLKEDLDSLIRETLEGVVRVKNIVQNLKDFSHVDESEWQIVDIHKGLDSTLRIVNNELKYKAEVVREYGELPEVECMPSQLNQVFMNLLVNAAHAIETRGLITVRTAHNDDWILIEIADTGKGIAPEHIKHIFEPFFTTKPVGQGTGLGLSVSYGIVEKHGGRIEVESELEKGTRFRVWLPVRQQSK